MAMFEVLRGGRGAVARLAKSSWIVDEMEPVADRVLAAAKTDPNEFYARNAHKRVDRNLPTRVRWIITLPKDLDEFARNVEAKRATMGRAADSVTH